MNTLERDVIINRFLTLPKKKRKEFFHNSGIANDFFELMNEFYFAQQPYKVKKHVTIPKTNKE